MGCKRDKEHDEERRLRRQVGKAAKRSLAADLRDDLSSYNDDMWTESMQGIDSVNTREAVSVEALLTHQSSAPLPKGKKKQLYDGSEDEVDSEYYEQYSESDDLAPKRPQAGPSKSIISIPG